MSLKSTGPMALIGGAGLGMLAMYLLDPELGAKRRERISTSATDAAHDARQTLAHLSQQAIDLGHKITERAGEAGAGISDHLRDHAAKLSSALSDRAGEYAQHLSNTAAPVAAGYASTAKRYADTARRFAKSHMNMDTESDHPGHMVAGLTAAGVGTLVLGAGAMYL